jgi:hypothetical protein
MGFEEDNFVADFFEKEVFFIMKNIKEFYLTEGNRPEYDVIIHQEDDKIVHYEVKAQKNLIIELAEIKKGSDEKKPSGISQSLADYYLFFHTSQSSSELAPRIKANEKIYYDLYIITKDEIMKIIKAGKLISDYGQLNNTSENRPDNNGKYLKNTGWGYTFNTDVLKKYITMTNQLAVSYKKKVKLDKDKKLRFPNYGYTKYINDWTIDKPDNLVDYFKDPTLNEPNLFYPENIDNNIVYGKIGVKVWICKGEVIKIKESLSQTN